MAVVAATGRVSFGDLLGQLASDCGPRTFFRWASRRRFMKVSPLQDLQPPGLATARDRVLTDQEMARIYKAAVQLGYPYGFICLIAVHTGMRRGEVGALKWS
jgi:integrase